VTRQKAEGRRQKAEGRKRLRQAALACLLLAVGLTAGCTRDGRYQPLGMWNGARVKPMEESPMAGLRSSALQRVAGTVARGQLRGDDPLNTGRAGGRLLAKSPVPVTQQVLQRGQERYNVYCSPCHGRVGNGEGMIVQRSFPAPPDYAIQRLREAPVGHFYDVMTNGYGVMYSYAERVPVTDRWAIASYIRVLQASRKEVPKETGQAERERARGSGIIDPARGMRLPETPAHNAPDGAAPGAHGPAGVPPGGGLPVMEPPIGPNVPPGGMAPAPRGEPAHPPAGAPGH
jgi:mono/diheme cytochrome c family protein